MSDNVDIERDDALEHNHVVSEDRVQEVSENPVDVWQKIGTLGILGLGSVGSVLLLNLALSAEGISMILLGIAALAVLLGSVWVLMLLPDGTTEDVHSEDTGTLDEWESYVELHQKIKDRIYHASMDWDTIFHYPSINDQRVKETQDLTEAFSIVQRTNTTPPEDLNHDSDVANMLYPQRVRALEKAWNAAWSKAQHDRQKNLSATERKTIDQIMTLLNKVNDGAATDSEKQVSYQRINTLMDSLNTIIVPVRAKELLAQEQQQALSAPSVEHTLDGSGVTVSDVLSTQGTDTLATRPHGVLVTKKVQ